MVQCPTCGDEFSSKRGMKMHHTKVHGESIAGYVYECEWCGDTFRSPRSPDDDQAPKYCPPTENEKGCYAKSLEGENNPNKKEERRKKISETMKEVHEEGRGNYGKRDSEWMMKNVIEKRDDSYLHREPSEETKQKLREAQKQLVENGEHHLQDSEVRKQIVETRNENGEWGWYADMSPEEAQKKATEVREVYGPKIIEVEETGNTVDSSYEAEVDRKLYEENINYQYNDGDDLKEFELEYGTYVPDFIIGDVVLEVKGGLGYVYDPEKADSFAKEMTSRDDVHYVVYGDVDLECDEFVEQGNLEELVEVIEESK